jgi:hypothetical protein
MSNETDQKDSLHMDQPAYNGEETYQEGDGGAQAGNELLKGKRDEVMVGQQAEEEATNNTVNQ